MRDAAIVIQSHRRAQVTRRHLVRQQKAAVTMQSYMRRWLARKQYTELKKGVLMIQMCYRRHVARTHYLELKSAAVVLQCYIRRWAAVKRLRGLTDEKKQHESAVIIQSAVRCYLNRIHYIRLKKATIIIQSYTRRQQTVVLLAHLKQEREAVKREHAATLIQKMYRGYVAFWHFQQIREACIMIQAHWRGLMGRRQYVELKWAVGVISEQYCALRCGREVRREQEKARWAVGVIQEHYLALMKARRQKQKLCAAVISVQRWYRCWSSTRAVRREYLALHRAVIITQANWRGKVARKEIEGIKIAFKREEAALFIQAYWRGHAVRKQQSCQAVQAARERVRLANASAQKACSIKHRLPTIVRRLKNCKYLTSLANQLHTLEMITLASESCSRALVEADCLPVLLDLIMQTNRSQAALVVVAGIIRILTNITKWTSTRSSILQCSSAMITLADLVYKVHNSQIALVLATLRLIVICINGTKVEASHTTVKKFSAVRDTFSRKGKLSGRSSKKGSTDNSHAKCIKLLDNVLNSFS